MVSKIPALTDALGSLVRFRLTPGQRYDSVEVSPLIDAISFDGLIADKALDNSVLVAELNERGVWIVVSQHLARAQKLKTNASIYAWRHLIENSLCKLTEFKRIARRACKTDNSFENRIYLAVAVIDSRWLPHRP